MLSKAKTRPKRRLDSKGNLGNGNTCSTSNSNTLSSLLPRSLHLLDIVASRFGRVLANSIPVLSIFALVGIMSYAISITSFGLFTNNKQEVYAAESTASTTTSASASLTVDNNTFYDNINAEYGITNYASHKVTISADNIDGYTLTITGPTNLTAPNGNNATTSDVTKWGYAWGAENATEANLTYNNFTGTTQNLETNTGITNNSVNLTKKLAFAATFTDNASDGHYKGTVGLGLTVTPKKITEFSITTMQEMTPAICAEVEENTTRRLVDTRDGEIYWVAKLRDGNCWMTQNLDYNGGGVNTNPTDFSNVATARYYDAGEYVFTTPSSNNNCGTSKASLADCTSFGWKSVSNMTASNDPKFDGVLSGSIYNAHYLVGNYYNFNAATNGTGSSVITGGDNASDSICPTGWQLPTALDQEKSYGRLFKSYGVYQDSTGKFGEQDIRVAPLYFLPSGSLSTWKLSYAGHQGDYITSTVNNRNNIYKLNFSSYLSSGNNLLSVDLEGLGSVNGGGTRNQGFSVRCVAK